MNLQLVPDPGVLTALISSALLGLWLIVLSHGLCKVIAPGKRFVAAALLTVGSWSSFLLAWPPTGTIDFLSGGMVLCTALLAGFTFWTLVAWGFTLSMLLALRRENRPLRLNEWIVAYTGGKTIQAFGQNRIGILFLLKLAKREDLEHVEATRRGRHLARFAFLLRRVFGLST